MEVQVIDNFLNSYHFSLIESRMMGKNFPWFYGGEIVDDETEGYDPNMFQFIHHFFNKNGRSNHYNMVEPIISKLGLDKSNTSISTLHADAAHNKLNKLIRLKGNLTTRTVFNRKTGYHIDFKEYPIPYTTAVFYINTNNGGTQFKNGDFIKSVANRVVIFDSSLKHCGVTCTDNKRRIVINFNYE